MRKKAEAEASPEPSSEETAATGNSQAWAMLIKRVYEVDPLSCPECGGQMQVVSFIEPPQADVIEAILRHCGLWQASSPRAPPEMDDLAAGTGRCLFGQLARISGPSGPLPGADLRRHRHVPGELLIIVRRGSAWGRCVPAVGSRHILRRSA
jgi:hypothetical protein